jgi:hypothetical protein
VNVSITMVRLCVPFPSPREIADERSVGELEEDFAAPSWDELGAYTSEADEQERKEELSYMYKWTCCGKPGDDSGGCVKSRHEEDDLDSHSNKRSRLG